MYNVLVFPCGSIPAIDINFALRDVLRVKVFGASSVEDNGKYIYENYVGGLPNISEQDFITKFNEILLENSIDFIIPTHDTVALYLVKNQERIKAKVISADLFTNEICRDKSKTYKFFEHYSFVPKTYEYKNSNINYPVFLKPIDGQGAQGTHIANTENELDFYMEHNSKLIICEYLPGNEYTVDCFTDKSGKLRCCSIRTRERTMAGVTIQSQVISLESDVNNIAELINSNLKFRGYWFFQLKEDKLGNKKLLEISTRFAGNSNTISIQDINLPLLSVLDAADEDITFSSNELLIKNNRCMVSRFDCNLKYKRVYIDLDDTILNNEQKYNKWVVAFIYQCFNKNIKLVLITQHEKDLEKTFKESKFPKELFDNIIHVNNGEAKYKYLDNEIDSIFIDNSFKERLLVRSKKGIISFDVNVVEKLIDWKENF